MKKTALIFMSLMMVSGSSFASPLLDYSAGKVAIDLAVRPNHNIEVVGLPADGEGTNFDWGVTAGIGHDLALQYRQFNLNTGLGDPTESGWLRPANQRFRELNLLYKVEKNMSVFVGGVRHDYHTADDGPTYVAPTQTSLHGGVIGTVELGKNVSAYGIIAIGTKSSHKYEAGISYKLTPKLDLDMYYKAQQINIDSSADVISKGMGMGVTYKF